MFGQTRGRVIGWLIVCLPVVMFSAQRLAAQELDEQATAAMLRAVTFFREHVGMRGGYLWRYSADLSRREGEGKADAAMAWVQPPGTPSVGLTFLQAYQLTQRQELLAAASETAGALLAGQLRSGGWDYRIYFDERRQRHAYRQGSAPQNAANVTTLDDNTTQSALQFLMRLDQELKFEDPRLYEAVLFALTRLREAQYPNGAWPQRFSEPPRAEDFPVRRAEFPESWSRTFPDRDYRGHYTLNDNAQVDMIGVFLDAAEIYREPGFREAALKGGDFLLLAQLPEPQPAWAQQYDRDMYPAWARRFEPPSVTGGESQQALRTLLMLYRRTGEERFLEPVPRALDYLRRSQLPDERLARFYELQTNRPLYFTRQYELTYRDDDLPTHYAFRVSANLEAIEGEYQALRSQPPAPTSTAAGPQRSRRTRSLEQQVRQVIAALDDRGAWVTDGQLQSFDTNRPEPVIETRTFIRNIDILSRYLGAER
jgi:PelA/Pel-15E family pectate lyase